MIVSRHHVTLWCVPLPVDSRETDQISSVVLPNPEGVADAVEKKSVKSWRIGTLVYTTAGLTALFFWLLCGYFTLAMKERAVYSIAQVMVRSFESPDWLVGLLVISLPAVIGLFLGPVVSVMSDRHRSRWGRRIPFLLIPTPVITLSMIGLAYTPMLGSWLHHMLNQHSPGEMACRVIMFGIFWGIFEIATVTVNMLMVALVADVVPQEICGRFFALFRAVGLICGILFNFYLMGKVQTHSFEIFGGLGLLFGLGFTLMCLKVKEGSYDAPPAMPQSLAKARPMTSVASYFRECFSNPFYLWLFLATTLGIQAGSPVNMFSIFHGRSLGMNDGFYGKCLALSYVISLALAYPIGYFADRFHPMRIGIVAMGIYAAESLYGFFFATSSGTFAVAFVLHTVVSGIYATGTSSIMQRMLPSAKFAQLASAAGLTNSFVTILLPLALAAFIQRMHNDYHYVFLFGSLCAAASAAAHIVLLRKYKQRGGDQAYTPPE